MVWGCWGNCTADGAGRETVTAALRAKWAASGVTHLLGFNEPDNPGQSDLSPKQAAQYWPQLDALAASFAPPLLLVGPGMTHWDATGGSAWLDQFLGNLSKVCPDCPKRIVALAQHDYSGDAAGIAARATALQKRYGRRVWLTEFSVGSGAGRAANDAFAAKILPLLDASAAVERYAWYSTRNAPQSWVNESFLLPPAAPTPGAWTRQSFHTCADQSQMLWLSQHGALGGCLAEAVGNAKCAEPRQAIYQSGDVKNCYCSTVPQCATNFSSWQDLYTQDGGPGEPWSKTSGSACAADAMLWLSQHDTELGCQAEATVERACAAPKQVFYEAGDVKNCYCRNVTAPCAPVSSTWLNAYAQPPPPPLSMALSSTGKLYAAAGV